MSIAPTGSVVALEAWMRERLNPLEAYDPAAARLDTNNPDPLRPAGPLHPAAVLIPLVEREEGLTVLLTRRSDTLRRHSGQIAFPGGRAEPGETPWDTALREAEEEIGLERAFVRVAGLCDVFETGTGFSITPVVGFVRPGFVVTPHEREVAEVFETPFAFLMDPENHAFDWREFPDGSRRQVFSMTHADRIIWGITAAVLRSLSRRLFD